VGRPTLNVQQIGKFCGMWDAELANCWELRTFVSGCDYYNRDQPMGCIAQRKVDDRIFAAPDYRFCDDSHYTVLWLYERRLPRNETAKKKS
jgi:hypothetical protein